MQGRNSRPNMMYTIFPIVARSAWRASKGILHTTKGDIVVSSSDMILGNFNYTIELKKSTSTAIKLKFGSWHGHDFITLIHEIGPKVVYKIRYLCARAWPSGKGILYTIPKDERHLHSRIPIFGKFQIFGKFPFFGIF